MSESSSPRIETAVDLADYFNSSPQREQLLAGCAQRIQNDLNVLLAMPETSVLEPAELPTDTFRSLYDPRLPTIAFDAHDDFHGSELMALAAAQEMPRRLNLLYVTLPTTRIEANEEAAGKATIQANAGILVAPSGQVYFGDFPDNVNIDATETADVGVLDYCHSRGIPTFGDAAFEKLCADKRNLPAQVPRPDIHLAKRYSEEDLLAGTVPSEIVIKPAKGYQGFGVTIADETVSHDRIVANYTYLRETASIPLIEERVRSWPLQDPETGERLAWNVRAVATNGNYIGMYVRAGGWNTPINKAMRVRQITIEDLPRYTQDTETAFRLAERLQDATVSLAADYPHGLVGFDLTIDESFDTYLYEINGGSSGGIKTLAVLAPDRAAKLAIGHRLVGSYLEAMDGQTAVIPETVMTKDTAGYLLSSLISAAYILSETGLLGKIPEYEKSAEPEEQYSLTLARWYASVTGDQSMPSDLIESYLIETFPVRIRGDLPALISGSREPYRFYDFAGEMAERYPPDAQWPYSQALSAARYGDLETMRSHCQQAVALGSTPEERTYAVVTYVHQFEQITDSEPTDAVSSTFLKAGHAYLEGGLEAAVDVVTERQVLALENEKAILRDFLFYLHFGAGDYQTAGQLLQSMNDDPSDVDFVTELLLSQPHFSLAWTSAEGIDFTVQTISQFGQPYSASLFFAHGLATRQFSRTERHKLSRSAADALPLVGPDEHREWYAGLLRRLSSKNAGRTHYGRLEKPSGSSDILKFGILIWRLAHSSTMGVTGILEDFEERDILPLQLTELSDAFSHLYELRAKKLAARSIAETMSSELNS